MMADVPSRFIVLSDFYCYSLVSESKFAGILTKLWGMSMPGIDSACRAHHSEPPKNTDTQTGETSCS
jgi:hypothetical protein